MIITNFFSRKCSYYQTRQFQQLILKINLKLNLSTALQLSQKVFFSQTKLKVLMMGNINVNFVINGLKNFKQKVVIKPKLTHFKVIFTIKRCREEMKEKLIEITSNRLKRNILCCILVQTLTEIGLR